MKVLNFGSLNIDYVYRVEEFVRAGETLTAKERRVFAGGKGLNQSLALARAGVTVFHAGAVGEADGGFLLGILDESQVDRRHVRTLKEVASGHAMITVNSRGENTIMLYGGANQSITGEHIQRVLADFSPGDFLLLQNEINHLDLLIRSGHERGLRIVLNPSPMTAALREAPLEKVDYLILNRVEAGDLCPGAAEENLLKALTERYPDTGLLLTLGEEGAYLHHRGKTRFQKAFPVKAVDTTGAGDTFTGYFVAGLVKGLDEGEALERAARAAAIAVTREGASASIPGIDEVLAFDF
ncbi:MAG: ribokinase [delta proteobacterium ML8_F1]|nr:MAG: ribokinase [delta proteobacterium ML8_F1]